MSDSYDAPMLIRSAAPGGLARLNESLAERLGFTAVELSEQPLLEWIHPDDRESMRERVNAEEGCARARHRTKTGDWIELDWVLKVHDGEVVVRGTPTQALKDAADRRPELTTARGASMKATLDAMARIVESKNPGMLCSILLVDRDRKYIVGGAGPSLPPEYNRAVEGLRLGPAVGSCGSAAFWNTPVIVENIAEDVLWKDLREAAAIAQVSACWSHPIATMQGEILGAMALYNREPKSPTRHQMDGLEIAARMVGLAIERDRLEEQLRRTMKVEAIGVLAGGIAHDFNNMLGAVLGNAELALSTLSESGLVEQRLREIVTASLGASDLCKQLLAYAGRGALTTESVEFNALVQEIGGLLQVTLSKKARLTYDLDDESLGLQADRSQLHRVIMNLMTNAAEAVGDLEGEIVIGTRGRSLSEEQLNGLAMSAKLEPGDYVELCVSDTGDGMSPADMAKIFDPFFSRKSTRRGLGLAAVQGIVHGHGGAIAVKSKQEEGTTFTVLLPRVRLESSRHSHDGADVASSGGRVLVVDDDEQVRSVIAEMLELSGHAVEIARDGVEALELFGDRSREFDCVLLDLSMPRMGGEEAFAAMRAVRDDIPVVLSSGFTEQEMMDRFRGAGLAGFLQKPARMRVLLEKVAAAIERGARSADRSSVDHAAT